MAYYVFIDESGDLGYEARSSKYLVITALLTSDPTAIKRCIRKVKQKVIKKKDKSLEEIKFSRASRVVKRRTLESLKEEDLEVYTIILNKSSVYNDLKENKNEVYNYVTRLLFDNLVFPKPLFKLNVIVDRHSGTKLQNEYNTYLSLKIKEHISRHLKRAVEPDIEIKHLSSQNELELQAVDMISGAIFNKYEFNRDAYYKIIKPKIRKEVRLFFNK